ncbi:unnamed protein product [Clonostachys rosea f. rosea IK726]|uniref:histidine kinase n=2 Tax=Bionectria ochroleuca TaxID=29856 RepID=A0A0B7JR81_BIOOC|nr:unnamed protein product [Clonostachys rosea f. rosea IK726]
MPSVKPHKPVSEGVRERETFKYDPRLSLTSRFNDSGEGIPSRELVSSGDAVLTALAQLGACQTGTERSLVSLFDSSAQHIVAEATVRQPLYASLPSDKCREPLWLCGTSIPRIHGVCELSLMNDPSPYGAPIVQEPNETAFLPLTLSQDLTTDPRFFASPFCRPGSLARFYAAVPIRTRRGINIGVYCVLDSTPNKPWTDDHTERLREISQTIMGHLEALRLRDLYGRSERMNRGLASFIEGKRAVYSVCEIGRDSRAVTDRLDKDRNIDPKEEFEEDEEGEEEREEGEQYQPSKAKSPTSIFTKAAAIIRESVQVDGCFFFDASMESYRVNSSLNLGETDSIGLRSTSSSSSSSDDSQDLENGLTSGQTSDLLGYSTSGASNADGLVVKRPVSIIAERFLGKLLHRYPRGKVFNFGEDGELQTSDSSEDELTASSPTHKATEQPRSPSDRSAKLQKNKPRKNPWSRRNEANTILQAFPNARSVAFIPIWDPRKERWYAGGFIYTEDPSRALTILGDLGFLRAFGTLAMAEVLRFHTSRAEKAKSDVLGSLSHELRSPLHGILLSSELLLDTDLDVFQGNTAHTIETCSRTLLDTIDHLLDFSKVNNFTARKRARKIEPSPIAVAGVDWRNFGKKNLFSNCRLDGLAEEVIESVFAGFTFQHSPSKQSLPLRHLGRKERGRNGSRKNSEDVEFRFANVVVFLHIDPGCDWMYCVQLGAFRRILMNIFGNALKYTQQGSIRVSLTQDTIHFRGQKSERAVRFVVQDTGKGIGPEYLRHGLFRPFSQEDTLAPGTGLGLSLVKRITTQLAGRIAVESKVDVGTTVTVELPLEPVAKPQVAQFYSDDDKEFEGWLRDLRGLRVKIMCRPDPESRKKMEVHKNHIRDVCAHWLQMEVIVDEDKDVMPDLIIWAHDAIPKDYDKIKILAEAPNIVICLNALEAYRKSEAFDSQGHFGIFEYISQPIGPRKLAKTLLLAYRRWMGPTKKRSTTKPSPLLVQRPDGPTRTPSSFTVPEVTVSGESSPDVVESSPIGKGDSTSETEMESVFSGPFSPCHDAPSSSSDTLVGLSSGDEASPSPAPLALRSKFLLVDDNHINIKVLSAYMKKSGLDYETAMDGQDALDCFSKSPLAYSCILMDISMPVMDGFEATRKIRAHELLNGLEPACIIALSGLASEDAQKEAFGSGMDLFLTKPVKWKALGGLLESRGLLKK